MSNARVSYAHNTRIVEFPFDVVRESVGGGLVSESFQGVIAFRELPFVVNIFKSGWLDIGEMIRRDPKSSFLRNWYGSAQNYGDIEAGAGVYIAKPEDWLSESIVGRSFYGITTHDDSATLSDLMKGDDLVDNGSTTIEMKDQRLVIGNLLKRMKHVYLSFPVQRIEESADSDLIRRIINSGMSSQDKARSLFTSLPENFNLAA